ncbi:nitrate/nitrite response regulator protein NarL [Acinetobacter junii SH205]|uniref:Response regulator n=2 Tax=Acinetobacter TaxID=469 RepID=A0AA42MTH0_ACIJO|nr:MULTISPECIES: response regulator [Acinetobacter]EEY91662.1 nitrate/nitrite response regulator protein NarL [Acinetobacter junii SH205]MDH0969493.1 response regulator [Acinetobacter johnsonii]PPE77021.1 DNA-binding response regulator [Kaistia algarum]
MSTKVYTETSPARLLLVDDHPLLRRAVAELLSLESDLSVVGQASNGQEALDFLAKNDVDLVILDHKMPILTGMETLKEIKARNFNTKTILFTVSDSGEDIQEALKLGVDGYLLKDIEPELIITDIRIILRGELVISPSLAPILAQILRTPSIEDISSNLTSRELQVIQMISEGLSNKMIAHKLSITESTVKVHVKHILNKTGLRTRVEAAVWTVNHLSK